KYFGVRRVFKGTWRLDYTVPISVLCLKATALLLLSCASPVRHCTSEFMEALWLCLFPPKWYPLEIFQIIPSRLSHHVQKQQLHRHQASMRLPHGNVATANGIIPPSLVCLRSYRTNPRSSCEEK
ncbi:mCG1044778, partial [Mus musculus]